jgi:hypothetical protein
MKNLIKIIVVLVLVSSCDDDCVESYVAIVNSSGKDVGISSYKKVGLDGKTIVFSKKLTYLTMKETKQNQRLWCWCWKRKYYRTD